MVLLLAVDESSAANIFCAQFLELRALEVDVVLLVVEIWLAKSTAVLERTLVWDLPFLPTLFCILLYDELVVV